jgi:hypothetical protein
MLRAGQTAHGTGMGWGWGWGELSFSQATLDILVTFLMAYPTAVLDSQNCCYCSVLTGVITEAGCVREAMHGGDEMHQSPGNVFLKCGELL